MTWGDYLSVKAQLDAERARVAALEEALREALPCDWPGGGPPWALASTRDS